jgi:hypothetical protein
MIGCKTALSAFEYSPRAASLTAVLIGAFAADREADGVASHN